MILDTRSPQVALAREDLEAEAEKGSVGILAGNVQNTDLVEKITMIIIINTEIIIGDIAEVLQEDIIAIIGEMETGKDTNASNIK